MVLKKSSVWLTALLDLEKWEVPPPGCLYMHNSLALFFKENQSNIHMKKATQSRPGANRLCKEWLSAKLCICLTAKFHPPLPLPVLPRDSLCFADLPYPLLPFSWMSLQPPWTPVPTPCPTNCRRNPVPGWAAPVSTPGSCASHSPHCHPVSPSSALACIAPLQRPQAGFQHFPAFLTCPPRKQHETGAQPEGTNQLSHTQASKRS